jgi:acetyl esterase/lipase
MRATTSASGRVLRAGAIRSTRPVGRRRGRGAAIGFLLAAVAALLTAAAAEARPVVLTIHGGGFYKGDATMMVSVNDAFEAQGFRATAVEYTVGDIREGWRDVQRAARRFPARRRVYAYGESAGGGFSALLATKRDLIDGAVVHSPVIDLRDWGREYGDRFRCTTKRCWRRFSPGERRARAPVLEFLPEQDTLVDSADGVDWAERERRVRALTWPGWHLFPSRRGRDADLRRAGHFFLGLSRR